MTLKKLLSFGLLLLCQCMLAQNDSVIQLKEVVITDAQLREFSGSQTVQRLNDSVISRNQASLTSLLNYNTVIYFKENGPGMVSSPSFRGTTAQQTAVIWNGININSQLNGQTDFNTLNTRDFRDISVRAGGGSVIYGSSAIGGSIHLNNELAFDNRFTNEIRADYGSFNTLGLNYKVNAATDKFSTQVSITRNSSDNDFGYVNGRGENINGQYHNTSLNAALAYKLNERNMLRLYSYVFDGERHFSVLFPSETKTKYQDINTRNLLEWQLQAGRLTSTVKVAYLSENYKYFANILSNDYTYGKVETAIGKYDLSYTFKNNFKINTVIDYTRNKGYGSDISGNTRNIGSAGLLVSHSPTKKFLYEAGIRKEVTDNYGSPLLYSAGINYAPADFYRLRVNASRNFRIPTFNDLYWQGSGNTGLKPETSYQAEIGNDFTLGGFGLSLTGYYIRLTDMLRWVPAGPVWRPENTDKVKSYGVEAMSKYNIKYGRHELQVKAVYGYTRSEDELTGKQLIYVPNHKGTGSLSYSYSRFDAYLTALYTGEIFTRSDNNTRFNLDPYTIVNAGAGYSFGIKRQLTVGVQAFNIFNYDYYVVADRPVPGRNYNVYINLNL